MFGLFEGKSFVPATDIPDLGGKVILVTGGNTGLGYEAVRQLAAHQPSRIYLAARTPTKGENAVAAIKKEFPSANVTYLPLDLSSFQSISDAVKQFKSESQRLDILMNNAGIMASPPTKAITNPNLTNSVPRGSTEEGYEIQFGTNHMGHALLTHLLMPTLLATAQQQPPSTVRIINLTSEGHNFARTPSVLLDRSQLDASSAWVRYGYSKLANILFTKALAKRYPTITSVAVHPGVIATDLYNPNAKSNFFVGMGIRFLGGLRGSVEVGARNQLWAATAPAGEKGEVVSGGYYTPVGKVSGGSPCARNEKLADELWEFTEREIKAKGY
ncbi:hypothetical protein ACLMJK_000984 [Lecanora helva]